MGRRMNIQNLFISLAALRESFWSKWSVGTIGLTIFLLISILTKTWTVLKCSLLNVFQYLIYNLSRNYFI